MSRTSMAAAQAKAAENKARVDAITATAEPAEEYALADAGAERGALMARAMKQWRLLKAWQKDGSPEDSRPETPDYDVIKANYDNGGKAMKSDTKTRTPKERKVTIDPNNPFHFTIDDKPVSEARNKLNEIAWNYTAGIVSKDSKRVPVREFRPMLAKLGVENPESPGWSVKLGNGIVLASVTPAEAMKLQGTVAAKPAVKEPGNAEVAAVAKKVTKSVAKKSPGQKARETTKAPAKATAAKKVTTNFKQTAKAPAKKTVAAARSTRRTAKR